MCSSAVAPQCLPLPLQVSAFPRLAAAYQCQSVHGLRAPMLCRRVATLGVASPMRIVAGRGESLPLRLCASRCLCRATPRRAIALPIGAGRSYARAVQGRTLLCYARAMLCRTMPLRVNGLRCLGIAVPCRCASEPYPREGLLCQARAGALQYNAHATRSLSPHCSAMPSLRLAQPRPCKSSLCLSNAKLLSASAVCGCSYLCLRPSALFPANAPLCSALPVRSGALPMRSHTLP